MTIGLSGHASRRAAPNAMTGAETVPDHVADAAAEWLTLFMSGEASVDDHARFGAWRDVHVDHQRAWAHVERVLGGMKSIRPELAYRTLKLADGDAGRTAAGRRKAMRALLWAGMAGGVALCASRTGPVRTFAADYRTRTGERRSVVLADGTHVMLNTSSAIAVQFNDGQRVVRLIEGEIQVVTAHRRDVAPDARPFIVETGDGRIRSLGTRFVVRVNEGETHVAVLESAVAVTAANRTDAPRIVDAGSQVAFSGDAVGETTRVNTDTYAWTTGRLIADDMPLGAFVNELRRYRPGIIRCDAAVAQLRISGVFPLADTGRILDALPRVLPLSVRYLTPYWVTLAAR